MTSSNIYYIRVHHFIGNKCFENFIKAKLPLSILNSARKYKDEQAKWHFLLGRYLLKEALSTLDSEVGLESISYTDLGKPYIPGNYYFNISHSSDLVALVVSDQEDVGIDVEAVSRNIRLNDFSNYFTKKEWDIILNGIDPVLSFYRKWTQKEAFLKAYGLGHYANFKDAITSENIALIKGNDKKWHLTTVDLIKDYCGTVCSSAKLQFKINELGVIVTNFPIVK